MRIGSYMKPESAIRHYCGSYFGFCESSIGFVWQNFPQFFEGFGVTVTCIDSTEKVSSSPTIKNRIAQGWNLSGVGADALWVPANELPKFLEDEGMLCGFDECYLSRNKPGDVSVEEGHSTTDGFNFATRVPDNFLRKFESLKAVRYLSDGLGLNFVTESLEVAEKLMELCRRE
jgi:hypothetical protein